MNADIAGKDVLLVDDDRAVLSLVEQWLTSAGYSVVACDQFEAAKRHLEGTSPDVLVTDVRLGAFNGLQLVILAKEQAANVAAVVMSAFDDPMLRKEANECGAAYITKPFTREQVLAALETIPADSALNI